MDETNINETLNSLREEIKDLYSKDIGRRSMSEFRHCLIRILLIATLLYASLALMPA